MGRRPGKLNVEFVDDHKTRKQTLKRRKECVMKKIKELSTLCDVKTCLVLYPRDQDSPTAPATVWPPNDPALVGRLVQEFKGGDDEKAPIGVYLQKKTRLVRAQIDRLKSKKQRELMRGIEEKAPIGVCLQERAQFVRAQIDRLKKQRELMVHDADQRPTIDLDNEDSSMRGIQEKAPIGVCLQKKAQLVRAQIDRLKSQKQRELMGDDQEKQDQFRPTTTTIDLDNEDSSAGMLLPRGVDEIDDLYPLSQQQQQQERRFGPFTALLMMDDRTDDGYDDSSMYQLVRARVDDQYPQQQQQQQHQLRSSPMCQEEEEDSSTVMMMPQQQQYEIFDLDNSSSTAMMMMDETCCGTGFDEQTSTETAAGADGGLKTQLYTPPRPPMMMWQSTDDDLSTQYIDLDDLWV